MNNIKDKYCIIDIGTNSIRLLLAEINDGELNVLKKDMEMTRIGKGVDKTRVLSLEGINTTLEALKEFKQQAIDEKVIDIRAIATSAVRDATNRQYFLKRVREEVGIEVEVIDGEREAELGFKGIVGGAQFDGNILAIDIGGGSTELILGNRAGIKYSISIDIGAVRLTDKYISTDPISEEELEKLTAGIKELIHQPLETILKHPIDRVVGIGGTITTLGAIKQDMEIYEGNRIHNSTITIMEIEKILEKFIKKNNDERQRIKGLQSKRADIILAGTKILHEILNSISISELTISDYDNLEGYVFDIYQ